MRLLNRVVYSITLMFGLLSAHVQASGHPVYVKIRIIQVLGKDFQNFIQQPVKKIESLGSKHKKWLEI